MNGFEWNFGDLNWLAVLVAVISMLVISSIWYMKPVTGKWWMADLGLTEEQIHAAASWMTFVWPIATGAVSAIAMALLIENIGGGAAEGVVVGAVTGLGIAAMAEIPHFTFGLQPKRLMVINTGQTAVTLTVMGVILGAWR
jgi:hypothetical protein